MSLPIKRNGSLRTSILTITSVSIMLLGIAISLFTSQKMTRMVYQEVQDGLENIAYTITNTYDTMYPGNYQVVQSDKLAALYKGEYFLKDDYIRCVSEDTNTEISVFAGEVRMISTLSDNEGMSLAGTSVNYAIGNDVLKGDQEGFYSKVYVDGERYFAYYLPLHNSDGTVAGIIAIAKPAEQVNSLIRRSVMPIFAITLAGMLVAGFILIRYSTRIIGIFDQIKSFIMTVEKGNLSTSIDASIRNRNDELGQMAVAATDMQKSIRRLVETDTLTGLYNRRYAKTSLEQIWDKANDSGMPFAVAIGDIDYFKKVNDTYGHDAGDKVLNDIASTLKDCMVGKGFAARWGGEEFLLVFERMEAVDAELILNELIKRIENNHIVYDNETIKITMSFGVTNGYGRPLETVLRGADGKLYYAKEHGRNCVVCSK